MERKSKEDKGDGKKVKLVIMVRPCKHKPTMSVPLMLTKQRLCLHLGNLSFIIVACANRRGVKSEEGGTEGGREGGMERERLKVGGHNYTTYLETYTSIVLVTTVHKV